MTGDVVLVEVSKSRLALVEFSKILLRISNEERNGSANSSLSFSLARTNSDSRIPKRYERESRRQKQ